MLLFSLTLFKPVFELCIQINLFQEQLLPADSKNPDWFHSPIVSRSFRVAPRFQFVTAFPAFLHFLSQADTSDLKDSKNQALLVDHFKKFFQVTDYSQILFA